MSLDEDWVVELNKLVEKHNALLLVCRKCAANKEMLAPHKIVHNIIRKLLAENPDKDKN